MQEYARIYKISNREVHMQNMHSPLCSWWQD